VEKLRDRQRTTLLWVLWINAALFVTEGRERKGACKGRQRGMTEARSARVRELHAHGVTVAEIANAMAISKCTMFGYFSEAK
jgi:DNA invertase Pin-like site-specific DNA recombinase